MKRLLCKFSLITITFVTITTIALSTQLDAASTSGGSSSSSSSSASSSSSSASSRGASSTSSSSSMSRSSAANVSRAAQQSSQRVSQQAAKSSQSKSAQSKQYKTNSSTKSLVSPRRPYSSSAAYQTQFMSTSFYNNWLYLYLFSSASQASQEKKNNVQYQMNMLKHQMKDHEKLYTVTVDTKQGKRVVVVPKKQYDKIQKGQHVKIKNGVVQ